jgi:[acyl-carrier-protein] S-malonyltransferase
METADSAAFIFPGMGPSAFADVGRFMVTDRRAVKYAGIADEALGYSLVDRFRDARGDYSEEAQVAFFVNCLALADWAESELGVHPSVVAGPSFGNKATAVRSGALSVVDGVRMTAAFARCLDGYFAEHHTGLVTQSFARIGPEPLAVLQAELAEGGHWFDLTCTVDENLHMLTLAEERLEWLQARIRKLRGLPLYVMRPPMHSPLFAGLRARAEAEVFADLTFRDPVVPAVSDHDGTLLTSGTQIRDLLLDGCVRRVDWPATLEGLRRTGATKLVIAGPDALFGRVPVTTRHFPLTAVDPRLAMRPRRVNRRRPAPAA